MQWNEEKFLWFWSKMVEIYGPRWLSTHGAEPSHEWRNVLQTMDVAEVKRFLTFCLQQGDDHPLTFARFCRRVRDLKLRAAHQAFKRLPPPRPASDIAKQAIADARAKLRKAG